MRINTGKDDPAGLIASESLRSDIVAVNRAITNSQRANQLIATADSALTQVSSLLNDVRGLVSDSANTGALSEEQIAANQLQVDSSLEAIDRIAQNTSFQGRKVLDGSLDFITSGIDTGALSEVKIDQANFGAKSQISVSVDVVSQATRGQLNYALGSISTDVVVEVSGRSGTEVFNFASGSNVTDVANAINLVSDATGVSAEFGDATKGTLIASSLGLDNDVQIQANDAGFDAGNVRVKYAKGDSSGTTATYTAGTGGSPGTLEVALQTADYVAASGQTDDSAITAAASLAQGAGNAAYVLTARNGGGVGNAITINVTATDNGGSTVGVTVNGSAIAVDLDTDAGNAGANTALTVNDLVNAINNDANASALVQAQLASGSDGTANAGTGGPTNLAGGVGADNNSLAISAKLKGADFNGTAVHFVDGDLLQEAAFTAGTDESVSYSADATAARAHVDFSDANADIILTANTAGVDFNNVQIDFVDGGNIGDAATASYDANTKVLTVSIDDNDETTVGKVREAINNSTPFTAALDPAEAAPSDATTITTAANTGANGANIANTGVSGGAAGTLFVNVKSGVTTANQVLSALATSGSRRAAELFNITSAVDNDGTGAVFAQATSGVLSGGVNGGNVVATGNDVVSAINNSSASGVLTASVAAGDNGFGTAGVFEESSYYGNVDQNNRLQFLGGADSKNVKFVNGGANQSLSVSDTRGFATLTRDSQAANSALVFTAKNKGVDFDGVRVAYVDDENVTKGNEVVTYDAESKVLKFLVASGNTVGNNTTADDITAALNNDDYVSSLFTIADFGNSDGTGEVDVDLRQAKTAELTFANGNNNLVFTAVEYGTVGNNLSVKFADGGNGSVPAVAFDANSNELTITIDDAATTANQVIQALQDSAFSGQFTATASEGSGAGAITIGGFTAATALAGGLGIDDGNGTPVVDAGTVISAGGLAGDALVVNLATDANGLVTTTANDLIAYFESAANAPLLDDFGISVSNAEGSQGSGALAATTEDIDLVSTGLQFQDTQANGTSVAVNGVNARVKVSAVSQGTAFDGVSVVFQNNDLLTAGNEVATFDSGSNTLTVQVDQGNSSADQVIAAINTQLGTQFTAERGTGGDGTGKVDTSDSLSLSGGQLTVGAPQGTNLLGNTDADTSGLKFTANEFGSDSFVQVRVLSGNFDLTDNNGNSTDRSNGSDVSVRINGVQAVGKGRKASINTSALDVSFSVNSSVASGSKYSFNITGGGAQFQLGPEVVSNQQARLGIQGVNTARLGGISGKLFELRSGGSKSLDKDATGAAAVVKEAISQITALRGRLGAFQRTTLESNIFTLNDALENLTEAESSIRDADFAVESAKLTRAQILVQSGTSVLSIANSNPQNALALLR